MANSRTTKGHTMNQHNERAELLRLAQVAIHECPSHLNQDWQVAAMRVCRGAAAMLEAQPAAIKPWQIMPTVKDRATNRELPVVGVYEDVVFVDVPAPEKAVSAWRDHGANTGMRHPEESDLYDGSEHAQPALEWVEPTDEQFHEAWNEHAAKIDREFNTSSNQNFFAAGWLAHGTKLREKNAGLPATMNIEELAQRLLRGEKWHLSEGVTVSVEQPAAVPDDNRCIRELREYAEKNQGTYIFPGWDGNRVTKYLSAAQKPQDDLPAILKKQAS